MPWLNLLLVALGGAAGSLTRYAFTLAGQSIAGGKYPLATLASNIVGCFLAGALGYLFVERQSLSDQARLLLIVGFLGGLTTFSSFGLETLLLARYPVTGHTAPALALANIAANVILSLCAVWAGWSGARSLWA